MLKKHFSYPPENSPQAIKFWEKPPHHTPSRVSSKLSSQLFQKMLFVLSVLQTTAKRPETSTRLLLQPTRVWSLQRELKDPLTVSWPPLERT